jgi:hypothetical protein
MQSQQLGSVVCFRIERDADILERISNDGYSFLTESP